nr:MAG TPA: hypothetical protein [Caudoviricetes sp.]
MRWVKRLAVLRRREQGSCNNHHTQKDKRKEK